jgi:hypothetical protein
MSSDDDVAVKIAVYRHFAATGRRPSPGDVAARAGVPVDGIGEAYRRLRAQKVLVLEEDGVSIRMAPPFSGVATQHEVESNGVIYHANCAWDALGIPAALRAPATVRTRCERSGEPLRLEVGRDGPERSDWLFHCAVPAFRWWEDIVFT